jgi:hypothetical protein
MGRESGFGGFSRRHGRGGLRQAGIAASAASAGARADGAEDGDSPTSPSGADDALTVARTTVGR